MKNKLLCDIKTAAVVFKRMRELRKTGADELKVEMQPVKTLPIINRVSFYETVEGCTLSNCGHDINGVALEVFRGLPYDVQHRLAFSPKNGEFIERAQYWKSLLNPVMTEQQCRKAMLAIIGWYIHIKKLSGVAG